MRARLLCWCLLVGFAVAMLVVSVRAEESSGPLRAGIIGLDTSHVIAFTKRINDPKATGDLADVTVVAGYPGGSPDVEASAGRVGGYTEQLRGMGLEICDSIDELLTKVDVVLLESVDGRPHLEQVRPVLAAGKRVFIDKPFAGSLADALEIVRLSKEHNTPFFSSSSTRFSSGFQAVRKETSEFGEVKNCVASSPMSIEPHHPDLFWYGVHGVEILYTIMGPGCETVTRAEQNKVVGVWKGGRRGTFVGSSEYGATVEGTKASGSAGKYEGYAPLVAEICKFFKTGKPPVDPEETLELFAFMEAADESKRQGGASVTIEEVMEKARKANAARK
ncbi:MAG: Gfo/Idh/MocA family oxidoreductase [Pirellulales bacterium]|nr:Gfo/Idh/MocA family oxidoreductase [Pirellulales bacterium]